MNAVTRAAVAATAIVLVTAGGIPSYATEAPTLPVNQHLFVVDCGSFQGQLWNVDSTNGTATPVGSQPESAPYCAGGAHFNPVDGKSYVIVYAPAGNSLYTYDISTGDATFIARISGAIDGGRSLVITNSGDAYLHSILEPFSSHSGLYSLDLETGVTTLVGDMGINIQAIAYNPVDDTIYAFKRTDSDVYTIDRSTGAPTLDADNPLTFPDSTPCLAPPIFSFQLDMVAFDSAGNLWIHSEACTTGELSVANFDTGVVTFRGQFTDALHGKYTNAPNYNFYAPTILITTDVVDTENETLASTGPSPLDGGGSMGLAASLIVAGYFVRTTLRRRGVRS